MARHGAETPPPFLLPLLDTLQWSNPELHAFFRQMYIDLIQGGQAGRMLLVRPNGTPRSGAELRELMPQLREAWQLTNGDAIYGDAQTTQFRSRRNPLVFLDPANLRDVFHLPSQPEEPPGVVRWPLASIFNIEISRQGQFSCPLQTGALFTTALGAQQLPLSGQGWLQQVPEGGWKVIPLATAGDSAPPQELEVAEDRMRGLAASAASRAMADVTDLHDLLRLSAEGELPPVAHLFDLESAVAVEFEPRHRLDGAEAPPAAVPLEPVLWFRFRSYEEHK